LLFIDLFCHVVFPILKYFLYLKQKEQMIQSCPHLYKTTNEKPCCMECGLVMDIENPPYIRCLKHYKIFLDNNILVPVSSLYGEKLKSQVFDFLARHEKFSLPSFNHTIFYQNYINFLENNRNEILPIKKRIRPITKIFGLHRKMFLEYLLNVPLQDDFSIEEC